MNFYRLLLHLYPSSFRAEYGEEMSAIFALELGRSSGFRSQMRALAFRIRRGAVECGHGALGNRPARPVLFRAVTASFPWLYPDCDSAGHHRHRREPRRLYSGEFRAGKATAVSWAGTADESLGKTPGYARMELSPANYRDLKASSNSFTALAAFNDNSMSLVGQGEPQRIEGASVTANLFSVLQAPALIGRYFSRMTDRRAPRARSC